MLARLLLGNTSITKGHEPRKTPMSELQFDEATHVYSVNGVRVPSVTQIIHVVYGIPWAAEEYYLLRGQAVHACAALSLQGKDYDFDPSIRPQVKAIEQFLRDTKFKAIRIEQPFYSKAFGIAGKPDAIGSICDQTVILDWKASPSKQDWLQLGFYSLLTDVMHGLVVQISDDETYSMSKVVPLKMWRLKAQNTLAVYNIMKNDLEMKPTNRKAE